MDAREATEIRGWLRRLPARDPLRPHVERLLAGEPVTAEAAGLAIHCLEAPQFYAPQAAPLAAALALAADLAADERARLLRALRLLAVRQARRGTADAAGRGCAYAALAAAGCGALMALIANAFGGYDFPLPAGWLVPFLAVVLVCIVLVGSWLVPLVSVAADREAAVWPRIGALRALGRLGDVESMGTMADACRRGGAEESRAAEDALSRVLPLLGPEHYAALPAPTVPHLCQALRRCSGVDGYPWVPDRRLALMLLAALEPMGDGRALEAVQRVAVSASDTEVQSAAERVLPVLQARAARERDAVRLLRPADAPAGGTLLRPAEPAEPDPAALLRPAERE